MTNKEMMVLDEMINLTNVPEEELSKHRINSKKYDNFLFFFREIYTLYYRR